MKIKNSKQSSFEVRFEGEHQEGLEAIVALIVKGPKGEYALAESDATSPLSQINVTLKGKGAGNYELLASLTKSAYGTHLPINVKTMENAGFNVTGNNNDDFFHLRHPKLRYQFISFSSIPADHADLQYTAALNGKTESDVRNSIEVFANALETAVNSIYGRARATPPEGPLYLGIKGPIERIATSPAPVSSLSSTIKPDNFRAVKETGGELLPLKTAHSGSQITFADIGGYHKVKEELAEFLLGIQNASEAVKQGYKPVKGVLLFGPPGTGKTLFGRAVAGEAGANFMYIDPTQLLLKYVGDSPKALREDIFEKAQALAAQTKQPTIIFIDEIDTIAEQRKSENPVQAQLVNVLSQYLNGFETVRIPNVYLMGATNRLKELDNALMRPPRFKHIEVPLPDYNERVAIFEVSARTLEREAGATLFRPDIDYNSLAKKTEGYSGAEIVNLLSSLRGKAFRDAVARGSATEVYQSTQSEMEEIIHAQNAQKGGQAPRRTGFLKD